MEEYKQIISNNISHLRRSKGMTQAELAEKLNYTDKAISKWERGESIPDAIVLKQIADMFGVSVDYLFTKEHRSFFSKTDGGISSL
ncbi:MAG: helix-turn-helix transcriptional regulator, partial [Clostridia bacterium]|nr:helix-turn-helix transcriptional regulator [Clostridia bacterium]